MPVSRYRNYIGEVIGVWEILEELGTHGDSPQRRYGNRRFRCCHIEHDIEMVRTMASIRASINQPSIPKKRVSQLANFTDYTNFQFGNWKVMNLIDDYVIREYKGDLGSKWRVVNQKTGEEKVMTPSQLNYHKNQPNF